MPWAKSFCPFRAYRVISTVQVDFPLLGVFPLGIPQLGVPPLGVPPLGVFPLGVFPLGVFPLGVSPLGVSPLGVSPLGVPPDLQSGVKKCPNLLWLCGFAIRSKGVCFSFYCCWGITNPPVLIGRTFFYGGLQIRRDA